MSLGASCANQAAANTEKNDRRTDWRLKGGAWGPQGPPKAAAAKPLLASMTAFASQPLGLEAPQSPLAGDRFVFDLNWREETHASLPSRVLSTVPQNLSILIVDDLKVQRLLLRKRMAQLFPDCRLVEAASAEEALSAALEPSPSDERPPLRYDLIIMDEEMGAMLGSEAINAMRRAEAAAPCHRRAAIVSCSGSTAPELRQRLSDAGADLSWGKPFPLAETMRAEVAAVLSRHRTASDHGHDTVSSPESITHSTRDLSESLVHSTLNLSDPR